MFPAQIPRLYDLYKAQGLIDKSEQLLDNLLPATIIKSPEFPNAVQVLPRLFNMHKAQGLKQF